MRRTAWLIGLVTLLSGIPVHGQETAQQAAGSAMHAPAVPRGAGNPLDRGAQWIRGKFAKQQQTAPVVDPVEADGPPQPPMPPRSVLRSTAGAVPTPAAAAPVPGTSLLSSQPTPAVDGAGASSEDLRIQQRIRAVEQMIKGEEGRLQQQLGQFARMRDAALKKEDANALKQIEQMERQTVAVYEKRMNQILSQMPSQNADATAAAPTPAAAAPVPPTAQRRAPHPSASRSRYRMPFGR